MIINPFSFAGSYYVSSAGAGNGTQASPWGFSQFLSEYTNINSGSLIYLNKGDTFNISQFNLTKELKFDAYGAGANPILRGSDYIGGNTWTLDASNIYYTTIATEPKWLFIGGTMAKMAESAFIAITARPSTTQVSGNTATLNALNTTESLVGSYIIAKEWDFRPTYRRTVTAYSTGVLTTNLSIETDSAGAGVAMPFKLLNHKSYISAVGDWCYDSAAQRLYVKTAGASPAGTDIRVSSQDYGINISSGVNNVSIKNIDFTHQYLAGVYGLTNNNLTIDNCKFYNIIIEGLSVRGNSNNTTITNNTLYNIANNAIHIGGVITGNVSYNSIYNMYNAI